MRLNSKGKLAQFYMWLPPDNKKLPQDLCTYFWGLVGRAFFVFGIGGFALASVIYVIGMAALLFSRFVWAHKSQALTILCFVLFAAAVIWLLERKKKIKIEILSEAKAIIKGKVDAVKGRYCPKIEWSVLDGTSK